MATNKNFEKKTAAEKDRGNGILLGLAPTSSITYPKNRQKISKSTGQARHSLYPTINYTPFAIATARKSAAQLQLHAKHGSYTQIIKF